MCGIAAAFSKKANVNEEILNQFQDQSNRGTNGFGLMLIEPDGSYKLHRATGEVKAVIDLTLNPSKMIIFHHRQPSSSKNKISQTHPIKISHGSLKHDYYFNHNGVIYGHAERKKQQVDELGYIYSTEVPDPSFNDKDKKMYNDSETLGYDIARAIEDETIKVETYGSCAFIMAQVDKKTNKVIRVFYGRNASNPLNLAKTRDTMFLSSEGKGEEVKPNMLYSFDLEEFKIKKRELVFPAYKETTVSTVGGTVIKGFEADKPKAYDYNDDEDWETGSYKPKGYQHYQTFDEWMTYDQSAELDDYLDAARAYIDEIEEQIKECKHDEELYLIDVQEAASAIAQNLARATEYARKLKIAGYLEEDIAKETKGEEDKKEEVKILGALPEKLCSR